MKSKTTPTLAPPLRPRRKFRGDARLAHLTPAQRDRLHLWLHHESRPYVAVVQLIRAEFGLTTSKSALSVYYRRFILPQHTDEHPDAAETTACLAALRAGHTDPYTIYRAHALAFSALVRPDPQIATATKLLDHLHRIEKKALARERLALKHERAALRQQALATKSRRSLSAGGRLPTSVPSVPPPCSLCPNSESPTPLAPPPTPDSSFPSLSSIQTHPSAFLQKSPPTSPRFPASSAHISPTSASRSVLGSSPVTPVPFFAPFVPLCGHRPPLRAPPLRTPTRSRPLPSPVKPPPTFPRFPAYTAQISPTSDSRFVLGSPPVKNPCPIATPYVTHATFAGSPTSPPSSVTICAICG